MRQRRILITGSSGRLGAALVETLSTEHAIVQLDITVPQRSDPTTVGPVFTGSITDPAVVAQAMEGVDTVIHCAAIPWSRKPFHQVVEVNVLGTFVVLEEAGTRDKVEQFIFISSVVYHGFHDTPREEHMPEYLPFDEAHPTSAASSYGCSKVQGEQWCRAYVQRFKKPVVAIRPSYIAQREHEGGFAARETSHPPHVNDYVGVSDLADLIRRCLDYHPKDGFDVFLANALDQCTRMPSTGLAEQFFPNVPLDRDKLTACDGFGALIDCSRAHGTLGWLPRMRCKR